MTVNLDEDTAAALQAVAATQGATVTAIVEALADCLAAEVPDDPTEPLGGSIDVAAVVVTARQISAARRARS